MEEVSTLAQIYANVYFLCNRSWATDDQTGVLFNWFSLAHILTELSIAQKKATDQNELNIFNHISQDQIKYF